MNHATQLARFTPPTWPTLCTSSWPSTPSAEGGRRSCQRGVGAGQGLHPTGLCGHLDRANVLFPVLFECAGESQLEVGNVLLAALSKQKLSPDTLRSLVPSIVRSLDEAVAGAKERETTQGVAWRFEDDYRPFRSRAGFFGDLAGFLPAQDVVPSPERAVASVDPWIAVFAAISLLRLGVEVAGRTLERIAANHEVRVVLDAFAAADMVGWLKYPTELGREPNTLERMEVFQAQGDDGPEVLSVWRFSDDERDPCAGISGVYAKEGVPGSVQGSATISKLAPWDSDTAEGHASEALETLKDWRRYAR